MARFRDWRDLAAVTFRSIESKDVTRLYSLEWPETRKLLMEEHEADIAREPRRVRRWLRSGSAILYGLTKRLAPQRRLLFIFAFVIGLESIFLVGVGSADPGFWTVVSLALSFAILVFLLAMELIDKIKVRDELELARDLQADLIPKQMPHYEGYEVEAYNQIANTVGGDIYDFVPLPDGRLATLFGDASGHGMAAGLVMAVAHAAFRTQLDVDPSSTAVFGALNRILCRTGGSRSFFAGVYLLLSPDGSFQVTVAGHPPVQQYGADGTLKRAFGSGAYPLGIRSRYAWTTEEGRLEPGDSLLLHSDGLAEARDWNEVEFSYERVGSVARRAAAGNAQRILEEMIAEYRAFTGQRPPEDDVSVAVLRRVPPEPPAAIDCTPATL